MVLLQGANGVGKSNLIEALYLLAIAKSLRASSDRELVRWRPAAEGAHAQVAAVVHRDSERLRVQVDLMGAPPPDDGPAADGPAPATSVQKYVRVNGAPRRTSDLVGEVNAVMFSAQDLQLVYGPPSLRRRYLDILISQLDRRYLRALQSYHRTVEQRNHLLKSVRERRSDPDELGFWDGQVVETGKYIMSRRAGILTSLSESAASIYSQLSGDGEALALDYLPSVEVGPGPAEEDVARSLELALAEGRPRELAQGHTTFGPHRDDISVLLGGMEAGLYASRGQSRSAVLAMKLAEAGLLRDERGQGPVLLLDDLLSELDSERRYRVLDQAAKYEQCFVTTADADTIDGRLLSGMSRFVVREGTVKPFHPASGAGS